MAAITLDELLKRVGVRSEKLNDSISDDHLRAIAIFLTSWRKVATYLELGENDLDDVGQEGKDEQDKRLKALQMWKGKFGFKATYRKLVEVLLQLAKADIAERVLLLLKDLHRAELEATDVQLQEKNAEIERLNRELQALRAKIEVQLQQKDDQIQQQGKELQEQQRELQTLREDKRRLQAEVDSQLQGQGTELRERTLQLNRQLRELQTLREERGRLQSEVEAKAAENARQQRELQTLREDRERLQGEVEAKSGEVDKQQREILTLREDRGRLQEEVEAKSGEIDKQQREILTLREDRGRLQAEVEARPARVELEMEEKITEIKRQQRELQTLRNQNTAKDKRLAAVQSQLQQLQAEMDDRSARVQQQLRERDAEINRLQRELRDQSISGDESVATIQSPYKKPKLCSPSELKLTCRKLPDIPETLMQPFSVTVDTVVYITRRSRDILRYDTQTQQWTKLPEYQYWDFTMTEVNHQLTLVGGTSSTRTTVTDAVGVYSTSQGWTHPYPPMNTPRATPVVSTYHQYLVVAGGNGYRGYLATVEILNTLTSHGQWLSITSMSLPVSCSQMLSAIVHDTLYLLGGTLQRQVLSVSLPALTQSDKPPAQWCTLPDTPLEYSAAIAVHGSLLAVGGSIERGGRHSYRQHSSAIHVYDQEKNVWTKVGDLPTERSFCTCCLLPSGEIIIAGGEDYNGTTKRMDIVTVTVWD